jgi:glyoxylase-like metal-dependent hydrolase (beta-lactamase superfamily II)
MYGCGGNREVLIGQRSCEMIEEILPSIYKIEIPLPGSPLKEINSYVIRHSSRSLIIDTGLNRRECMDAMKAGLHKLGVKLGETDFFITHLHADHFALTSRLVTATSSVYLNRPDAEMHARLPHGSIWDDMVAQARMHGFPERELQSALRNHPGYRYGARLDMPLSIVNQGDTIEIGQYSFLCIETPGHTRGHMCLFEPNKKILFSGDHILGDITPNIQSWFDEWNPLHEYLLSLDKVYELDVEVVLPGHRSIVKNCRERIRELKHHHRKRAEEVLSILEKGNKNAFQVASQMSWDIICESWDMFPASQKWFATGEAIAHLKYLEEKQQVFRERVEGEAGLKHPFWDWKVNLR